MFHDVGVSPWIFEVDETSGAEMWTRLAEIVAAPERARAKIDRVMREVDRLQQRMVDVLRTAATEFQHIQSLLAPICLAHPDVQFRLLHNHKPVYNLGKTAAAGSATGPIPAAASGGTGACASNCPEWASDDIGARELFNSCAMTRITFFQVATSCELISRVSCLRSNSRCGMALSMKRRCDTW